MLIFNFWGRMSAKIFFLLQFFISLGKPKFDIRSFFLGHLILGESCFYSQCMKLHKRLLLHVVKIQLVLWSSFCEIVVLVVSDCKSKLKKKIVINFNHQYLLLNPWPWNSSRILRKIMVRNLVGKSVHFAYWIFRPNNQIIWLVCNTYGMPNQNTPIVYREGYMLLLQGTFWK